MDPGATKRRKIKAFPPELEWITDADGKSFALALEVDKNPQSKQYNQELHVAQSIKVTVNGDERIVDLAGLVLDHLRPLAKNLGVVNCGSLNKYNICQAIALYFTYQESVKENGSVTSSNASRITNAVCRAVNVIFSCEQFIEEFKSVNDRKSRRDHGTRNTNKDFWIRATVAHNSIGSSAGGSNVVPRSSSTTRDGTQEEKGTHPKMVTTTLLTTRTVRLLHLVIPCMIPHRMTTMMGLRTITLIHLSRLSSQTMTYTF